MTNFAALALRQDVEDRIMLAGRRVDDPGISEALTVTGDGPDRVYVSNQQKDSGGSLALMIKADETRDRGFARLDEMLRRTLRARARLRAIGDAECHEGHAPEWSFTLHRMIDGVLRGAGADPMWLLPMHRDTGGQKMLDLALEGSPVALSGVKTVAGRIQTDVMQIAGDPRMLLWENGEGRGIRLAGTLPQSVILALPGMRLGDVVEHPLLTAARDVRIESAGIDDGVDLATIVRVEDDQVPVRPAPEGADTAWLGMPF